MVVLARQELQAELLAKLPAADAGLKLTLRELERKPKDVLEEASQKLLLELLEVCLLHPAPPPLKRAKSGLQPIKACLEAFNLSPESETWGLT